MTLRYKRRYQPRLRRTWLLAPYHRIGHSGIVVLAGFGFTGIELGDWITHRSQHYASYDDFFTTVDLWESTDREIVALRLLPYREYAAVRIDRLGGKSSISGLAEWIIQFCEDPPRYYGKFVTGPVSRRYLSEHALVLASWMDALFRSNAPDLAAQLRSALILLANGEIGSPQLETATKEALIALGEFSVEAPSDVVHMIGSGPKAEFGLSSGWAFANCRLLGRSRAPIANPHLQGSRPERTRRGRIATPETNGFQSLIINARREYGLDRLSTLRSPLSKAFTAETPEDFASAVSLSFEHAFEELSSSGIPKRVLQRRLMDLGGLVRAVIGAVSERFDRIPALRAIDYAAYLLSNQLTNEVGIELALEILHSSSEESDAEKPDLKLPPATDEESIREWVIQQSWQETIEHAGELGLPFLTWQYGALNPEVLASTLSFSPEVGHRVVQLCGALSSFSFESRIAETGALFSLMISNPMLSEASNNLNCAVIEDEWVYWTSNWEDNQAGVFIDWVRDRSEQLEKFAEQKQREVAARRERWQQIDEYRIPDPTDDAWSFQEIELPELDWSEYPLDPDGDMLVDICAKSDQPARLSDLINFLDDYNPEWLDGGGGMIRSGWRSSGCILNTKIPEIARYVEIIGELYDLTGTWLYLDDILVRS